MTDARQVRKWDSGVALCPDCHHDSYISAVKGWGTSALGGGGGGGLLLHMLPEVAHNNASTDVAEVCQQLMLSTEQSVHHNPIKSLWGIACIVISCTAITPLAVQELTDALIRGLGQIPRRPSVIPSGMCTDTVGARGGRTQRSHVRSCPKFTEAGSSWALTFFFTFFALWFLQTKKKSSTTT